MGYLDEAGTKRMRDDYVTRIENVSSKLDGDYTTSGDLESNYVTNEKLTTTLEEYETVENAELELNKKVNEEELKAKVEELFGSVVSWGGSVENYDALESEKSEEPEGTIFNCQDTGENYIKTADGWDKFDVKIDLAPYAKTSEVLRTLENYVTNEKLTSKNYVDETSLEEKGYLPKADFKAIDTTTIDQIIAGTYEASD